jgi:hypothetical protein
MQGGTKMEYQTQFTKENILELSAYLSEKLKEFQQTNADRFPKLDAFLIVGSLGNVAYNIIHQAFPIEEEERKRLINEMKTVTDHLLRKIDAVQIEFQLAPAASYLAMAHLLSLASESLAKDRDREVQAIEEAPNVKPVEQNEG